MKNKKGICIIFCGLLFLNTLKGQDKLNIKFAKISLADFDLSKEKFDTSADAIIIADVGSTSFEGNAKSSMTMVYTRFRRVKILNRNGFSVADYAIRLYHNSEGDVEKLSDLKASTFNLENGAVVETKLDEKAVFTERYDKNNDIKKFTVPALQVGSIYDITYTIKSDFYFNLRSWEFQGEYPILWSEYMITVPPVFEYMTKIQGDGQFDINSNQTVFQHFTIRQSNGTDADDIYNLSGNSIQRRWVKKNVAPLVVEPYITTLENYISKVSFQLHYIQWSQTSERHNQFVTWFVAAEKLLQDDNFGIKLSHDNAWLSTDIQANTEGCKTDEEKIKKIFYFVRSTFSCTDHDDMWARTPLKDVYKKKGGNVAEINLLLTAMLRQAHIVADPVILSTREHGVADQIYPLIEDYNYVICVAYAGNKTFKLDASRPYNGFDCLVSDCYNGGGRIVNQGKPYLIDLSPDSLRESRLTTSFIINDEKGYVTGSYKSVMGSMESYEIREELAKTSQKDYFKKIQTNYGNDVIIENPGIDSLNQYEYPLTIHYDFDMKNLLKGDVIYFNPMMTVEDKVNPFKSEERKYPVEMKSRPESTYVLVMDIPKGYQVEELPKSARVAYNGNEGIFEYLIQKNADNIQMRVHLKLNKAFFPTDEYTTLRDFFGYVVKKENEQIVFKKIP